METSEINNPKKSPSVFNILIVFFLLTIIANLALLDYWIIKQIKTPLTATVPSPSAPIVVPSASPHISCDDSCLNIIKEATASLTKAINEPTAKPQKTNIKIAATPTPTPQTPKEFYITLGSGTTAAGDWSDLPDILIPINRSQYSNVKAIYFEATINVPGSEGIAYARLYNTTDGKAVENSDITTSNPSPQLLTSQPVQLEGYKTYKIQMKSSERKDINLTNGRIKIVIE